MCFRFGILQLKQLEVIRALVGGCSQLLSFVEGQLAPSPPRGMTPLVRRLAHRRKELRHVSLSPQPFFPTSDGSVKAVATLRTSSTLATAEAGLCSATVKISPQSLRLDPEPCMPRVPLHFSAQYLENKVFKLSSRHGDTGTL
jgi:hypothetical protein